MPSRFCNGLWNFGGTEPEEFLTAGYVVFIVPVSHTNFTICAKPKHCKKSLKTRLVFPTKARNAKMLLKGFNDHFSGY